MKLLMFSSLPFLRDTDCALGIAVKHYLDELSAQPEPTSEDSRNNVKEKGSKTWFPHAVNFIGSLEHAFELWDAVSRTIVELLKRLVMILMHLQVFAAVKLLPDATMSKAEKEEWGHVDEWLAERR